MRKILFLLMFLPLVALAGTIDLNVDIPVPAFDLDSNSFNLEEGGYGLSGVAGKYQMPAKTVNILLPAGAEVSSWNVSFGIEVQIQAPEPTLSQGFLSSDGVLSSSPNKAFGSRVSYSGTRRWGDLSFASFRLLPASYDAVQNAYLWSASASISLSYFQSRDAALNRIPPTLMDRGFFANAEALSRWYRHSAHRNYDYLIVSTPELYAAAEYLEIFRQSQGLVTAFADISEILATSPGSNDAEKLRNYLIQQYQSHPFTYLLLIGDIDVVPIAMLTPEPNGYDTVPSDFYYSDLSSDFDTDNDGRLGEYSTGVGNQDWGVDFTPELFVGRIAWSNATAVASIAERIVSYEQSSAPWKNTALLPAAFLNYQDEPEVGFAETDGALFIEFIKETVIRNMQTETLYEQIGVVPSYPSDYDLDYSILRARMNSNSYGLINWSAHGSATSSSRKVWVEDSNQNNIPESWEMQWMGMVNRESFDNLSNQDGSVIFCASCYNGRIDHTSASLAEYALLKKGVAVFAATRTGWYKIGWQNPGWGGLSSYNYHFLENHMTHGMSVGAAHAYSNLLHTQYYLFGDPIDSDGIIWPELQNVYTYLLFGDPAVGHSPASPESEGEILVWEPNSRHGLAIVNAINELGNYNVIYTDKLIPDYDYIHSFDAVFGLLGFGNDAFNLEIASLEYNLLDSYLDGGGRLYLEGGLAWDEFDPFFAKFGTIAPYDHYTTIEGIKHGLMEWSYTNATAFNTPVLVYNTPTAQRLFECFSTMYPTETVGVWNTNGNYRTIASSFQLHGVTEPDYNLLDIVAVIFDTLNVGITDPVSQTEQQIPAPVLSISAYPNPFSGELNIAIKTKSSARLEIFNLRGQLVTREDVSSRNGHVNYQWLGTDQNNQKVGSGIYLIRATSEGRRATRKILLY